MNNFFEQLKKEGQNIRLSQTEKNAMRARIFGLPRGKAGAPSYAPAPSPYAYFFTLRSFSVVGRTVMAALLIFVVVGSGTAYAAEGALPGEPLYAVKINVNEAVQVALASTPVAKAQVHAALAQRRVEEAEALAARGALDATTSDELAANFEDHARVVASSTKELAQRDPAEAAQVEEQFRSSIGAHGQILAQLSLGTTTNDEEGDSRGIARAVLAVASRERGEDAGRGLAVVSALATGAAATGTPTATLAVAPRAEKVSTFAARAPEPEAADTERSSGKEDGRVLGASSEDNSQKIAAALEERAGSILDDAKEKYAKLRSSLSADLRAQVEARLASTSAILSQASAELGNGDYIAAQGDFAAALRGAVELAAFLDAQQKFQKQNILPQLLQNSERTRDGGDQSGDQNHSDQNSSSGPSLKLDL